MLQFRSFMIANQMRLIGRNMQLAQADNATALTVYTGMFGLVMMGALIDGMKGVMSNTTVTGQSLSDKQTAIQKVVDDWKGNPGKALYDALDRGGIFGPAFEGLAFLRTSDCRMPRARCLWHSGIGGGTRSRHGLEFSLLWKPLRVRR